MPHFPDLPDDARLWLIAFDGDPAPLLAEIRAFCEAWTSHGRPVQAQADVLAERVLAVAAVISPEEMNAGVSGCGIDAMQRAIQEAGAGHALPFAPALDVTMRDPSGAWVTASRATLRTLASTGAFATDTHVLDLTPTTLGGLRAARGVERRAGDTWLATAFHLAA